jgi:excisionase family DNA binding protein
MEEIEAIEQDLEAIMQEHGLDQASTIERTGVSFGVSRPQSLPGGEVNRMEDKNRMKITITEAAEYLGLTPTTVQDMVERGVLKADKFAGAVHIPREEVERIERETAP